MKIENNKECFVQLWQQLERTRQLFGMQQRRYCVRRILKSWLGMEATDDLIWEVCRRATYSGDEVYGLNQLPPPSTHPRVHREILIALVQVSLRLGKHNVNISAIDEAYSIAFPDSTPIDVRKRGKGSHSNPADPNPTSAGRVSSTPGA